MKVWTWRQAIQRSSLSPITKLVLFNLSVYMNEIGESCFPTVEQQTKDTGLGKTTIHKHLKLACDAGFILKTKHGFGGQQWANNEYKALMPSHNGSAPDEPPSEKVVREVNQGSSARAPKVVHQVNTNTPVNTPKNTSIELQQEFIEFWKLYPNKKAKGGAEKSFYKARKSGVSQEDIMQGLQNYIDNKPGFQNYKHPTTWLNQGCWADEYETEQVTLKKAVGDANYWNPTQLRLMYHQGRNEDAFRKITGYGFSQIIDKQGG